MREPCARLEIVVALLALTVAGAPASASTVTLTAVADAGLTGAKDSNTGTATSMEVSSPQNRVVVRFDQAAIAAAANGLVLTSASLQLYVNTANHWGSGSAVDVHRLTVSWTESGVTWNCPIDTNTSNSLPDCAVQWAGGTFNAVPSATILQTDSLVNQYESFDVTADVAAFLNGTPNDEIGRAHV